MAMFQFMGGEITLVTAGEAKRPMRDLPIAARYMNSALYVSSRTLFTLAQRSAISAVRSTLGRTNNGHTPLAAITVSFLPGTLAFLAVKAKERAFQEPLHVFTRLYTGPLLCIYATECLAFLRFLSAIKFHQRSINRNSDKYREKHYRAHWQPVWAILGLTLCTLLMLFSGWAAIYDLCARSPGVDWRDAVVDLVAAYLGVKLLISNSLQLMTQNFYDHSAQSAKHSLTFLMFSRLRSS
ncbi:MAG: hypothetical protein LQ343_007007 [Gyalolechia ehrenbergii]|nr:MAG: hypothetical protein LQ343_007007 [Gyalolechia ehrenbergii]